MTCPSLLPQLQAVASHRADVLWVPATSQGPAWGATGQCLVWGRSLGCAAEATLRFAVCFFFFLFHISLKIMFLSLSTLQGQVHSTPALLVPNTAFAPFSGFS